MGSVWHASGGINGTDAEIRPSDISNIESNRDLTDGEISTQLAIPKPIP